MGALTEAEEEIAGLDAEKVPVPERRVLNAGSGPYSPAKLHQIFRDGTWQEVRLDIDAAVKPDVIGSITDLKGLVAEASFDAVWTSHNIEHLHTHEVPVALREFRRVLKAGGFLLVTCPDLEAVAEAILSVGPDETLYVSPAGPVTALDILFGHGRSIERGNYFMAHHTAFTADRLGSLLIDEGFDEAWVLKGRHIDLWAVGLMPEADRSPIAAALDQAGLDFSSCADHRREADTAET